MSKRNDIIRQIRYAGYHEDRARFTRLYIENRISLTVAHREYNTGRRMRENGIPCGCAECQKGKTKYGVCPFCHEPKGPEDPRDGNCMLCAYAGPSGAY